MDECAKSYDGYGHAAYDLAPDYKERLLRLFSPFLFEEATNTL